MQTNAPEEAIIGHSEALRRADHPTISRGKYQLVRIAWSTGSTSALKQLIQQQWNFSPTGSIIQIEDYEVDLNSVRMLQLIVSPEINSGPAVATLVSWHIA